MAACKPAIIALGRPCMARGTGSSNPFPSSGESHKPSVPRARPRHVGPRHERSESVSGTGTGQGSLSRVAQNALELCSSDPINLAHLSDRHTILHPRPDAGKLRAWDLARRRRGVIAVSDLSGKTGTGGEIIGALLAWRLGGRAHLRDGWRTALRFREQRFGRLTRLRDPLAIITARMRLLFSTKQDFPPKLCSHSREGNRPR